MHQLLHKSHPGSILPIPVHHQRYRSLHLGKDEPVLTISQPIPISLHIVPKYLLQTINRHICTSVVCQVDLHHLWFGWHNPTNKVR